MFIAQKNKQSAQCFFLDKTGLSCYLLAQENKLMSDKEREKEIKRYLDILSEDFQHKLNLIIDGLTGKIESTEERLSNKIDTVEKSLNSKIDSAAKDLRKEIREVKDELISHRDNTEAHVQKTRTKKRA